MGPEVLAGLAISLAVAYWATPVAIRVADRFDFYDRPVGYKGHARPTPYLGGTAVMAGFLLTVAGLTGDWDRTLPLAGGVIALWGLGTVDDRRNVTPGLRVLAEAALATMLWATGLGWTLGLGGIGDWVATVIWVVAVVNAFNLFDNMDGAASAMAAVVAAALAVLGMVEDDVWLAVVATALCGACVGFLPHNLASPSRIFLGDGGSMPIGFAVAALAMIGAADAAPEWQSLAMGILLVGVPALDTALVIVSRTRRGVSIVTAGQDHITHRARRWLRTARAVALTLGAAQAIVSALALVALRGNSALTVVFVVLYLVTAGIVISLLDAPEREARPREAAPGPPQRPAAAGRPAVAVAFLVLLGLGAGLSPFFSGYYHSDVWVPAALGLVLVVAGAAIARPLRPTRTAAVALGALAGLGLLALASALWTDSIEQAVVDGNRLLGYAMLLGALLLAVRERGRAVWVLGAAAAGAAVVAVDVVVRMLGDRPAALFIEGRLNEPLGYINGQASFFLIALWVCVAVAEQRRRPLLAGAGAGLATALGCLLVLSQSRGVALAALASTVLVLALLPGRLRRAWALLVVVAGTAAATPVLVDVYTSRAGGVDTGVAHAAARATLLAAVCAGVVWSLATMAVARAGGREPGLRRAAAAGLAVLLAAGVVTAAANQGTVRRTADEQYTAFVKQRVEPQSATIGSSTTRLASGAGNRYEYWRIAWGAWRDHPVGGTGAGGYDKPYFAARTTGENVRQPHSIVLQALSELGLGGALLLALLVGAVAAGALRVARAARESAAARFVGVAATGAFAAWLVHTSVDWMHLLPGLTAMALAGAAALLVPAAEAPPGSAGAGASRRIGRRLVPALVVGSILVVASVSLARQGLTEHFRAEAQDALAANPAEALVQADRALRLDHEAIGAYYVKSAALARFGRGTAARAVLLEATRREPENFVTWTLLGDLSVRMSNLDEAREHYRRALRLNPRDESLQDLVVHPEGATARLGGG